MSWKAEAVAAQESFLLELVKEMIMRIHYKKEKFQAVVTKHLAGQLQTQDHRHIPLDRC